MALPLRQPFLDEEFHPAACELAKDRAPGPDGLAVDFFTIYW
jgi:hypothetical protein